MKILPTRLPFKVVNNMFDLDEKTIIVTNKSNKSFKNKGLNIVYLNDYTSDFEFEKKIIDISKKENISEIVAFDEIDILRVSSLREYLNIETGLSYEESLKYRNKLVMKDKLKNSIKVPDYQLITSYSACLDFYNSYKKIVIKPNLGFGSKDTYIIKNQDELNKIFKEEMINNYIMEEFIEGDIYTIDGVWNGNKLEFFTIFKYINNCLSYQENSPFSCYILTNQEVKEYDFNFESYIKKILEIYNEKNKIIFHCELFKNDKIVTFCEIACRPSGGGMSESIAYLYNTPITKISENYQNYNQSYSIGVYQIPYKKGKIVNIFDIIPFDWVIDYSIKANRFQKFKENMKSSTDSIGRIYFKVLGEEDARRKIKVLNNFIETNIIWK